MVSKSNKLGPVVGFIGLLVTIIVVGVIWQFLKEVMGIELLAVIIVVGLVITGVSMWYTRERAHKRWLRENRDLIEGRNRRNRPGSDDS